MESPFDARGLAVSTTDRVVLDRYEAALQCLHSGRGDALAAVDAILADAPDFAAAIALRAAIWILGAERPHGRALRTAIATVDRRLPQANERERRHLAAARAWLTGNPALALARYGTLVTDHPRDSLALHVAQTLDFRLGRRESLRDRVEHVLPHWSANLPGYAAVLGMHAFGLEENGLYDEALESGRRALALDPLNASAMHAVVHVFEMRGQARAGVAWMNENRAAWQTNDNYVTHLAWHLALFHIDLGRTDDALAVYDRWVAPGAGVSTLGLVDASALLWRLALRGRKEDARWEAVARAWRKKRLAGQRAFNVVHAVIALAAAGALGAARRASTQLAEDRVARQNNSASDLALAVPFTQALLAFVEEDYGRATELIRAVLRNAQQCGGSIAQCDLIHLTLVEAALRSERAQLARVLAAERAARKPQSPLNQWLLERAGAIDLPVR